MIGARCNDSGVSFSFCFLSSGRFNTKILWLSARRQRTFDSTSSFFIRHLPLQFFFRDQITSSVQSFAICNCEAHTCDERNSVPPLLFPLFVRVTNFFLSSEMMTELCLTTVIRDARCGEFCQNVQLFPLGVSTKKIV